VVGFVTTKGTVPPAPFLELAEARGVPVLRTAEATLPFIKRLTVLLEKRLAPGTTVHGVLMSIQGVGVLILGKSGIGKSECALDLVSQGHRLVADDLIHLQRIGDTVLVGSGPELARHHMEIRGLGIINIKDLFGVVSVLDTTRVDLVVELVAWDVSADHDRLGLDEEKTVILEIEVPRTTIPVSPGRNLAVILEVAARNWLLKKSGYHAPRELERNLRQAIARVTPPGAGEGQ
jgi:HPr kinase/phosphorylase